MSDNSDFFGDVFENPDDDPLLGGEGAESSNRSDETGGVEDQPSWMSEDTPTSEDSVSEGISTNGKSGSSTEPSGSQTPNQDPNQKEIVVDQETDAGAGIKALNQAVQQGWRLVRISLPGRGGEPVSSSRPVHRFVAILEKENPQSLFDFG
jgi:hypothetical protein